MSDREIKIQKLKDYFEKREDIVMAFLFGSQAEGRAHEGSDWDVAVYFKPEVARVEWEEQGREYPSEDRVWSDCADMLETDRLDLIVLNRAPATIADAAIHGEPLIIKDRGMFLDFMLIITGAAEDFRQFVDDYYAISQRSHSLTPRDRESLERSVDFLEQQMTLYPVYKEFSEDDYINNLRARNEIERWVENMVNPIIEISKIILASEKRIIPYVYRESVKQAIGKLELPETYVEKFDHWVKIRNEFAHEYLDLKWQKISTFVKESEPYITHFLQSTKQFLEKSREKNE